MTIVIPVANYSVLGVYNTSEFFHETSTSLHHGGVTQINRSSWCVPCIVDRLVFDHSVAVLACVHLARNFHSSLLMVPINWWTKCGITTRHAAMTERDDMESWECRFSDCPLLSVIYWIEF